MNFTLMYTAADIEVLTGLDPVKKRPGMYTDTSTPNHLAQEVLDNSIDEVLAGFASEIYVTLFADNSLEISDNGRGMPVDIHHKTGLSGIEVVMTRLHSGGKFSGKNYKFSGGLHGVGVSVVNALSTKLEIVVKRDGKKYQMVFGNGFKSSDLVELGSVRKKDTGTSIRFWPDKIYFDQQKFNIKPLKHLLRAKAVLCPNLKLYFSDQILDEKISWHYENGISEYLINSLQTNFVPEIPFSGYFENKDAQVSWCLVWAQNISIQESYVNLIPTPLGGTHVNGLRSGIFEALNYFCDLRNLLPRNLKLQADDLWENCQYILSLKMHEPQFAGQTKERLSSRQSAAFVNSALKDAFTLWLNQHPQLGELIASFAIEKAQRRLKKSKQVTRKKVTQGPALPGKLADCLQQGFKESELFLVEGDSAGGSAKQARNKDFQAIMPLRGKILNSWEVESDTVLASQEIHDISVAIGVDPGSDDISGLRYGKICILADADSDGAHIATLLCALFFKHFKAVISAGHIFVAMPPLYRIDIGKEIFYALDDAERDAFIAKRKASVQRFKGLGEMNPKQLQITTMHPDSRRLIQLRADTEAYEVMDMLLAKKRAKDRKVWLESSGNLADI